ncbi:DMT family transporter [Luteimonas sp. e5]
MNLGGHLLLAVVAAVLIGAMLPLQGLINARLGTQIGGAVQAAFVSFIVGSVALGLWLLAARQGVAAVPQARLPAWIWAGGLIGALYVAVFTLLVPRLGAASIICLAILGQLAASLLLDHFGVLQPARPASALRVLGAVLVLAGALLVVAPWQARPDAAQSAGESSR